MPIATRSALTSWALFHALPGFINKLSDEIRSGFDRPSFRAQIV